MPGPQHKERDAQKPSTRVSTDSKACLGARDTDLVASQAYVGDAAVPLEGLSQCLDCATRESRSDRGETLLTPQLGLSTLVTNFAP